MTVLRPGEECVRGAHPCVTCSRTCPHGRISVCVHSAADLCICDGELQGQAVLIFAGYDRLPVPDNV